ncbi:MAG TPA: substrate-binding domain-containing protein [Usitatibacter sp.]|jgi:phosphate transport system substrate-binding protein|nr:substrate-binding domain-containing protein [Usitatibacter sp.]
MKPLKVRTRSALSVAALSMAAAIAHGQNLDDLPVYVGKNDQFGEIRIWGNQAMTNVLRMWEAGIMEGGGQRGLRFVDTLPSGSAAIGPLYTGVADLGIMGHHVWPVEIEGFHQVFGYDPLEIAVATGSYDVPAKMPSNVIYVNKDNPLAGLTLPQLDAVFGEQRTGGWEGRNWSTRAARGPEANIRTWGGLGATGEWADKPIHVYGYDLTGSSFPFSMQRMVFGGSGKWNPGLQESVLNEVSAMYTAGPRPKQGCDELMQRVADDRYGIGYSAIQCGRRNPGVRPVALASRAGGPYIEPTKENFLNRSYPLIESIYVYINRAPGQPVEPKLKEFLKYILSRQGQKAVVRDGGYLPLTADVLREQLRKLE